ncbi:2597_t:CDS:2, partial [Acaulospora morrowiae]
CSRLGSPFVFGNIKELGNWETPVKLRQSTRRTPHGVHDTYWFSEPIKIYLSDLENIPEIRYKYGIAISQQAILRKNVDVILEGFDAQYERVLWFQGSINQYDVWENNDLLAFEVKDFAFLDIIYNSLNAGNLKEKIFEFQLILENQRSHLATIPLYKFIRERFSDAKLKEQKLFLLVLLGYRSHFFYERNDISESMALKLLDVVKHIREDTYPSDISRIIIMAIDLLVRLSAHSGFSSEKNLYSFLNAFKERALPHLENVDEYTYIRVMRWLVKLCQNMKSLVLVWNEFICHSDEMDEQLQHALTERVRSNIAVNYDIVRLDELLSELPEGLARLVVDAFRDRVLSHLRNGRAVRSWPTRHFNVMCKFLENSELFWTFEDYLSSLDSLSQFADIDMLAYFIPQLERFLEECGDFEDVHEEYPQICKRWYQNLLNRLYSASTSSANVENKYVFWVFQYAARLHPLIKENKKLWRSIITSAINEVKKCPASLVYKTSVDVIELGESVVNEFIRHVKNLLSGSVQSADEQLLNVIRQICRSTGEVVIIPN